MSWHRHLDPNSFESRQRLASQSMLGTQRGSTGHFEDGPIRAPHTGVGTGLSTRLRMDADIRETMIRNQMAHELRQQNLMQQTKLNAWQAQTQIIIHPPKVTPFIVRRTKDPLAAWYEDLDEMYAGIGSSVRRAWSHISTFEAIPRMYREYLKPGVDNSLDALATTHLWEYLFVKNRDLSMMPLSEAEKKFIFRYGKSSLPPLVLLKEFTSGTGPELRTFTLHDKIAKEFLKGYVIESVLDGLYTVVNKPNYKGEKISYKRFLSLKGRKDAVIYNLAFSPDMLDPSTWSESHRRHRESNPTQLVIGGAMIYALPSDKPGWAVIRITNAMSRQSFMLHAPVDNYYRKDGIRPLSTIHQRFVFSIKIDPDRFPPDLDHLIVRDLMKPVKPLEIKPPWR